jgi:alpha-D-ribose 1-methylphosphonate 5-triphosphate synthase subunit PhnI
MCGSSITKDVSYTENIVRKVSLLNKTNVVEQKEELTTQQQHKTMRKPMNAPAVPTTHVRRINRMTPKMFWMQGR